ncbi:hypothetical protein VTN00DRAFT_9618 [Thermoascus crustaceus]|uniref:uncharacterized protein n=1 Tax=Thermoascus crustaceus TaxID=5088 RepID=UPI0037435198
MAHIRHLYHCIKGRTSKARRIRIVWQVPSVSKLIYTEAKDKVKGIEADIDEKLKIFSLRVRLPAKLIQYHLGRYTPVDDGEQQQLDEQVIQNQALISKLQNEFREFEDKIKPQDTNIERIQSRMRIMNSILCWVNSKFDDIKKDCELHCTIYQQDKLGTRKVGRAEIIGGSADLNKIFTEEVANHRERIAKDTPETRGEMLVMVSASHQIRDCMRRLVCKDTGVHLREFEYQSM